jgi:hypothetical protein
MGEKLFYLYLKEKEKRKGYFIKEATKQTLRTTLYILYQEVFLCHF